MATLKQIEANRRNSLLSTGPKTPEGKAAVCFNALKSGIHAESLVIPGEDPAQFQTLIEEFTNSWNPYDPRERELADELAIDTWRLKRLRNAEAQVWIGAIDDKRKCNSHCPYTEIGDAYLWRVKVLGDMQRQVNSIKRNLRDTTRELQRLQASRGENEPLPPEPLSPPEEPKTKPAEQSQYVPGQVSQFCSQASADPWKAPSRDPRGDTDLQKLLP